MRTTPGDRYRLRFACVRVLGRGSKVLGKAMRWQGRCGECLEGAQGGGGAPPRHGGSGSHLP